MVKNNNIPLGVKILSILGYIGAGLNALFGLALIFGSSFIASLITSMPVNDPSLSFLGTMGTGLFIGIGVIVLLLALLEFIVSKGLWEGKNWARMVVLVVSSISVFAAIINLIFGDFSSIFGIMLYGIVIYYLEFIPETKKYFLK
jgi:hypothetical protein